MEEPSPYVEIETPERTWRFDRRFLLSSWRCIYGGGCRGLHETQDSARADGCCTEGAALTDAEDFMIVARAVAQLDPAKWQFSGRAKRTGWYKQLPLNLPPSMNLIFQKLLKAEVAFQVGGIFSPTDSDYDRLY